MVGLSLLISSAKAGFGDALTSIENISIEQISPRRLLNRAISSVKPTASNSLRNRMLCSTSFEVMLARFPLEKKTGRFFIPLKC